MFSCKVRALFNLTILLILLSNNVYRDFSCFASSESKETQYSKISSSLDIADTGKLISRFFDEADGLPQNTINAVAIDKKGYIWVGTQDGAAYYNGRNWTIVNMPNRTKSNGVFTIFVAEDGALWFGTNGAGLSRYFDGKWTTYDTKSGLPNDQVRSIVATVNSDKTQTFWIGTSKGLASFSNDKWTIYDSNSVLPNNVVRSLITTVNDSKQILWVGTEGGLVCFQDNKWTTFTTNSGLPNNVIRGLAKAQTKTANQALWVGTEGGVARFEQDKWTIYNDKNGLPSNEVRCLLETTSLDGQATLWVGTGGFGLARFQDNKWTTFTTKSGLPDNSVWSLLETKTLSGISTLWIGLASRGGLAKLEQGKWITFNKESGLPNSVVFSLLETKENDVSSFWIGTDEGLAHWEKGTWTNYNTNSGLPNNTVRALLETQEAEEKIIWVGTEGGLVKINKNKWKIFDTNSGLPSNRIYCLLKTKNEKNETVIWVGTREGLVRYESGNWYTYTVNNSELPSNVVRTLLETRDANGGQRIWVGTEAGLACLKSNQWLSYKNSGLSNNLIRGLLKVEQDGKQWLWVGTDGGVFWTELKDELNNWRWLSDVTNPSIANNTIYQIRTDNKNRIYLSTNKGITRLTRKNSNSQDPSNYEIYQFTTKDGLPSNECNSGATLFDSKNRIWIGTIGGAALFDPNKEFIDNTSKPFYIDQFLASGQEKKIDKTILDLGDLPYYQNNIKLEYSLLNYIRESDNRYQFQLIGYDKNLSIWTDEAKKEYSNLSPGFYTFKVWAKDYLGNVSGPLSVSFRIQPAPWQSWWAYSIYLLLLSGSGYWLHTYRLQRLAMQNRKLEAKVLERTEELAQKNNELVFALEQIKVSQKQTEEKNQQLGEKNKELDQKNEELAKKNLELIDSHKRADRIFSALADALPGTVLDEKYKLDEKIGSGGFGAVYRATHLAMKRPVAVKIFRPTPGNDSIEALERFQLEAISSCRIQHPNSVAVLDSGVSEDGIAYLVMELLKGKTLKEELLDKKRLSIKRCIKILLPICDVLWKAHRAGVIHRDIKPDNIFLHQSEEGEIIKVVDFGIAKLRDEMQGEGLLTNTGGIIGTPAYMSPERLSGQPYDGRSDVYSLGIMFYQMLSGQLPFSVTDGNLSSIILKHLVESPKALRNFQVNISEPLEKVLLKALEKDQNLRPNAKEFAELLAEAVELELDVTESGIFSFSLNDSFDEEIDITNVTTKLNNPKTNNSSFIPIDEITITGTISSIDNDVEKMETKIRTKDPNAIIKIS